MDQNDILQGWQQLNERVNQLEQHTQELASQAIRRESQTLQMRLAQRYRRKSILGFMLPFLSVMLPTLGLSKWVTLAYAVVGLALGVLNYSFARYVSRCDYPTVPTVEAMEHAVKVLKYQTMLTFAGYLIVAMLIFPMFYELVKLGEPAALYGAIAGLVIGLIIGISKSLVNHSIARKMMKQLEEDLQ